MKKSEYLLTTGASLSRQQIESNFGLVLIPATGQLPDISFIVGKTWKTIPVSEGPVPGETIDQSRLVAFWASPASAAGMISLQIFGARFEREISAANWLRRCAGSMGYDVRVLGVVSNSVADSIVEYEIDESRIAGRLVVRIYGADIVVALASVERESYDSVADVLAVLVRAVSADGISPGGSMEKRKVVQLGGGVSFSIPQSWSVSQPQSPDSKRFGIDVFCPDMTGLLRGRARIKLLNREVLEEVGVECEKLKSEFVSAGLKINKALLDRPSFSPARGYDVLLLQCYSASIGDAAEELEFGLVVLGGPRYLVFIASLFPNRRAEFVTWALGNRGMEIFGESLSAS